MQRIIDARGTSTGQLFCAVGAQALNSRVVLKGLIGRVQSEAKQKRAKKEKQQSTTSAQRTRAQEILALGKADEDLDYSELGDLLK